MLGVDGGVKVGSCWQAFKKSFVASVVEGGKSMSPRSTDHKSNLQFGNQCEED